jgi:hypothetical protein
VIAGGTCGGEWNKATFTTTVIPSRLAALQQSQAPEIVLVPVRLRLDHGLERFNTKGISRSVVGYGNASVIRRVAVLLVRSALSIQLESI